VNRRTPQTRTEQARILAAAAGNGTLPDLYWYIVSGDAAVALRTPDGCAIVPVLPVAPEPEITRHWAHMMLELAQQYHPKRAMSLELTARDVLDAHGTWHDWTQTDFVCPGCGAVNDCIHLEVCRA
jgi:hypothetical protein